MKTLKAAFKTKEIRKKILYTLVAVIIFRLGSFIPVPFVNTEALKAVVGQQSLFGLFNILSGGNFENFTIFALGITPYINASIIVSLLVYAIPYLEKLKKDGEDKIIDRYTYGLTVILAVAQALGLTLSWSVILTERTWLTVGTAVTLTTLGTMFLTWMGNKVTDNGIANGISILIFAGILSRIPRGIEALVAYTLSGALNVFHIIFFLLVIVATILAVIEITESERKVPVVYHKKIVGRKQYGGQSSTLPIKINTAGVIPVIFASTLTLFPATIASFFPNSGFASFVNTHLAWGSVTTTVFYTLLIFGFTYFYTIVMFNTYDISDTLKSQGGIIPGIRPGMPTKKYLDRILNRLTLTGAFFLAVIALIPIIMGHFFGYVGISFGGTSLLIVVGVAIEIATQVEQDLKMYEVSGFLAEPKKKKKVLPKMFGQKVGRA